MRAFSIGLTPWRLPPSQGYGPEFGAQAVRAEQLEFDSLFVPESHFFDGALPAPLTLLSYAAACTKRLRLGTTSLLLPVRQPLLLAEEISVLDRLSEGRLILGLGRGFRKDLFDVLEVDGARKRDLLEDSLRKMCRAWTGASLAPGEPAEESTARRGPRLFPLPAQAPHPPLWMAAFGPKALGQAARLGLPYLASPLESEHQLLENYSLLHREVEAIDGVPCATKPIMRTVFVHPDSAVRRAALDGLAMEHDAWKASAAPALARSLDAPLEERVIVGNEAQVTDRLGALVEELGMTHLIARCRVPGVTESEVECSVEALAGLRAGHRLSGSS